jgi:outer membrane protein OmpA-like peptidoglycan-associated protein
MKKLFAVLAIFAGMISANAQEEYTIKSSNLFWDNWYASANVGAITPFKGNLIKNTRFNMGVEVGRFLTPVFGLGAEYRLAVNTTPSVNMFDQSNLTGLMKFNLTNLFLGYTGEPRFFEMGLNYGIGWGHNFVCSWPYPYVFGLETGMVHDGSDGLRTITVEDVTDQHGWDMNYLTSKLGLEFNFNLGEEKAWQFNVKPALVWAMHENFYSESSDHGYKLNGNMAAIELVAGLTYKFGNSNGTHNFVRARLYDQNEVDFLNGQIFDLKGQLTDKDAQLAAANDRIAQDAKRIKELEDVIANFKCDPELETIVNFACASSRITNSQTANVERVANFLNANENAKVSIKGYASPEGGTNYNQKLSERRANAVKDMLIKKYGIDESRISAEGCGETEMFSKREANRCAINIAK